MVTHEIALIPGDGIGPEVVGEAVRVLDATAEVHGGFNLKYTTFPWGCRYYLEHGIMMPRDGLKTLRDFESIFLGAVGWPGVDDHVSLWGLLIPIRKSFEQYVNLRPIRQLRGIESRVHTEGGQEIDFVIVRENSEGEYSNIGGRIHSGTPFETAIQVNVFSRMGVERVLRHAFELTRSLGSGKRLTVATKSNGITYTMPFWDQIVREVQHDYPDVPVELFHIDALAAYFVIRPHTLDVVVATNLFGDILSDLGAAVVGSIGVAPSGNLNPERKFPSMFEPVHGSAPDIAGKGVANPIGQIWSGAMMLKHLGYLDAEQLILSAIEDVLEQGICTPDLGGNATTVEVARAICERIKRS